MSTCQLPEQQVVYHLEPGELLVGHRRPGLCREQKAVDEDGLPEQEAGLELVAAQVHLPQDVHDLAHLAPALLSPVLDGVVISARCRDEEAHYEADGMC